MSRRALVRAGALCCVALVSAWPGTRARGFDEQRSATRVAAPLWHDLGRPSARRAHELEQQALAELREGMRQFPGDWHAFCVRTFAADAQAESLSALRGRARALRELSRQALRKRAHIENAIARLERALELAPDDPELLYALGHALMKWEQPAATSVCASERREQEASAVLERLVRAHPDFMLERVALDIADLAAHRGHFAEAAQAYQRVIAVVLDADENASMRTNLAEMTMLAGDLERAVELYERALRESSGGRDYLLALWGLAVALDRLGEEDAAQKQVAKAVEAEAGRMHVLRSDGVFYEPEHEIHYYEGLGHEAIAARSDADSDRARELAAAAASFRAFIAGAAEHGAFAAAARASLERVQRALAGTKKNSHEDGKAGRQKPID